MNFSRYQELVQHRFGDAFLSTAAAPRDRVLNTAARLFLAKESDTGLARETLGQMRRIVHGRAVGFDPEPVSLQLAPVGLETLEKEHGLVVDLAEPEPVPGDDRKIRLRGRVDRIPGRPGSAGVLQVGLLDYEGQTINVGRCDLPEARDHTSFDVTLGCFDMEPAHVAIGFDRAENPTQPWKPRPPE